MRVAFPALAVAQECVARCMIVLMHATLVTFIKERNRFGPGMLSKQVHARMEFSLLNALGKELHGGLAPLTLLSEESGLCFLHCSVCKISFE